MTRSEFSRLRAWYGNSFLAITAGLCMTSIGCTSLRRTPEEWFNSGVDEISQHPTATEIDVGLNHFGKAENNYCEWGRLGIEFFEEYQRPAHVSEEVHSALTDIRDPKKALARLKQVADTADPYAQLYYGFALYHGLFGTDPDREKGLAYLRQAADSGQSDCSFYYAYTQISNTGIYIKPNLKYEPAALLQVLPYLVGAADQGSAPAQCLLAHIFDSTSYRTSSDLSPGTLYYCNLAAAQHYPPALYLKGILTSWGSGCVQDRTKGIKLIREAALSGYAPAQFYCSEHLNISAKTGSSLDTEQSEEAISSARKNGSAEAYDYLWDHSLSGKAAKVGEGALILFVGLPLYIITAPIHVPIHIISHMNGGCVPDVPYSEGELDLVEFLCQLQSKRAGDRPRSPTDENSPLVRSQSNPKY